MPNVLILPRSADYSEEVWMEIREKAINILQSYLLDGVLPINILSGEEEDEEDEEIAEAVFEDENDPLDKRMKEDPLAERSSKESGDRQQQQQQQTDESHLSSEYDKQRGISQLKEPLSVPSGSRSEGRRSGSHKKGLYLITL